MRAFVNFCEVYLIRQKPHWIPTLFPTILIYNINGIYECNPHFILFQFIQKSSDINRYLKFSDNIRFELISDRQNKNYWKCFLFRLKSAFRSRDTQILVFSSSPIFLPVSHCFRGCLKIDLKVCHINCIN